MLRCKLGSVWTHPCGLYVQCYTVPNGWVADACLSAPGSLMAQCQQDGLFQGKGREPDNQGETDEVVHSASVLASLCSNSFSLFVPLVRWRKEVIGGILLSGRHNASYGWTRAAAAGNWNYAECRVDIRSFPVWWEITQPGKIPITFSLRVSLFPWLYHLLVCLLSGNL